MPFFDAGTSPDAQAVTARRPLASGKRPRLTEKIVERVRDRLVNQGLRRRPKGSGITPTRAQLVAAVIAETGAKEAAVRRFLSRHRDAFRRPRRIWEHYRQSDLEERTREIEAAFSRGDRAEITSLEKVIGQHIGRMGAATLARCYLVAYHLGLKGREMLDEADRWKHHQIRTLKARAPGSRPAMS